MNIFELTLINNYINSQKYQTPNIVYKKCIIDNIFYIIILGKMTDTITNELRCGTFDMIFSQFRGNKFIVCDIISIIDKKIKTHNTIINTFNNIKTDNVIKTQYSVSKVVYPHFYDKDINNLNSGGIHYFISLEGAFYYNLPMFKDGIENVYDKNGILRVKYSLKNGIKNGLYESFDSKQNIIRTILF